MSIWNAREDYSIYMASTNLYQVILVLTTRGIAIKAITPKTAGVSAVKLSVTPRAISS